MIEAFDIPIKDLKAIKQGADFVDKEGFIVSNDMVVRNRADRYHLVMDAINMHNIPVV